MSLSARSFDIAGYWTPIAFLAASSRGSPAQVCGMVGRCPSSGGAAFGAFGSRSLAITVGWGIIATGIVSGATIATGFVTYASVFVDWSTWWDPAGSDRSADIRSRSVNSA